MSKVKLIKGKAVVPKLQNGTSDRQPSRLSMGTIRPLGNMFGSNQQFSYGNSQQSAPNLLPQSFGQRASGISLSPGMTKPMMPSLSQTGNAQLAPMAGTQGAGKVPGAGMAGAASVAGMAGGVLSGAGDLLEGFKKKGPVNTWGIETQTAGGNKNTVASSALKTAGKGASTGAAIGSLAGPLGTVIGGAVGAVGGAIVGLFKGKKQVKEQAKEIKDSTQMAYQGYHQNANAQQYAALGKAGAKLTIMKRINESKTDRISAKGRKFKSGGKFSAVGETNIIPSGTLHKEKNNLGNKDKGLPVVDKDGKKIFEIEREELILRLQTTQNVEALVDKYKKSHNDRHLVDLGKLLSHEIMSNTQDNSGKYGLGGKL